MITRYGSERWKKSKGVCELCGGTYLKRSMSRHLEGCRRKQLADSEPSREIDAPFYHIGVMSAVSPHYWLHLDVCGSVILAELDRYRRDIWPEECCDHLSAFTIAKAIYSSLPDPGFHYRSMNYELQQI